MSSPSKRASKSLWDPSVPVTTTVDADEKQIESETRRILRTAHEINGTASATLVELDAQGKKIVKAQDTIAGINDKMNSSDRMIQEIGSFWSSITSRFRSEVPKSEYADRRAEWEDQHTRNMEQVRGSRPSASAWGAPSSKPSAPPVPATASQDQIGRDLDDILLAVRDMKAMAEEMNVSLEEQNRRLDHLNPEIDLTTARIKTARTKVQTLIDKA